MQINKKRHQNACIYSDSDRVYNSIYYMDNVYDKGLSMAGEASEMMRNLRMDLSECQSLQLQCEQAQDAAKVSRAIHQRRDFLHVSGAPSPSARPSWSSSSIYQHYGGVL